MRYLKIKAYKIFKIIIEWELARTLLKFIINNLYLPYIVRQYALIKLANFKLSASTVYLKSRCFISNQPRSIISLFKLNRVRFKFNIRYGLLAGIKKSS